MLEIGEGRWRLKVGGGGREGREDGGSRWERQGGGGCGGGQGGVAGVEWPLASALLPLDTAPAVA